MKKIDYEFLTKLQLPGPIAASPRYDKLAFILSQAELAQNEYISNLWLYDGQAMRQMTFDGKVRSFAWEDNAHILFAAVRSPEEQEKKKEGEAFTSFYRLSLQGGEAQLAFSLPLQVHALEALGQDYFLLAATFHLDLPNIYVLDEDKRKAYTKKKKEQSFVTELTEIPFYFNGRDYIVGERKGLFLYNAAANKLERISKENLNVDFFFVSEDKQRLYYTAREIQSKAELCNGLYYLEFPQEVLTAGDEMPVFRSQELYPSKDYRFSLLWETEPDRGSDSPLAVFGTDMREYGINESPKLYVWERDTEELQPCWSDSFEFFSSLNTDVDLGSSPQFFVRQGKLYLVATERDHDAIFQVEPTGELRKLYAAEGALLAIQPYQAGVVSMALLDMYPAELYFIEDNARTLLSDFNRHLFQDYELLHPQKLDFHTAEELDGWVIYPLDFVAGEKYPAILDIHGGPRTAYGPVFFHEMQIWAQRGYFVLFCNPRGSAARGDAFADIRGKYGTIDYDDIMGFLDSCLEQIEEIDHNRLGVTGGSYGGFMSNWIIGHTNRFKACATQRSISNWVSFYGTSDIGYYFACDQLATKTNDQAGFLRLWDFSPLRFINSCKTPTLIIHSAKDYRCPLEQGLQLFTALKDRAIPAKMLVFHEETHELSRSGKPQARIKRLEEITNWMDKYVLKGEEEA